MKESKVHGPGVKGKGLVEVNMDAVGYSKMDEIVFDKVIEPGFSKLPSQKVTPFRQKCGSCLHHNQAHRY